MHASPPPERGGPTCPGVTRRNFLRVGRLGAGALALPALLRRRARGGATPGRPYAGGGVKYGQVLGSSDRFAAYPRANSVTPADVVATIYHATGIDGGIEVAGLAGRPVELYPIPATRPLFR
jgi:hypothetical protein